MTLTSEKMYSHSLVARTNSALLSGPSITGFEQRTSGSLVRIHKPLTVEKMSWREGYSTNAI
jgi:hypothetical protein